jgi:geranylgeranyl diphosphate synthase type I
MFAYMAEAIEELIKYLRAFFDGLGPDYDGVNSWGRDALTRLLDYTCGGKMLRGSLVGFTHDMYAGGCHEAAVAAGAAMEIFQSAFLIHDDIMDRDERRRGKPAIHAQYMGIALADGLYDPAHMGEALGICAGDLALFIAFDMLSRAPGEAPAKARLLSRFCRELEYVGIAQMADVWQGARKEGAAPEEILGLYRYKTGRYTFSLPFAAGLILAGQNEECVNHFVLLGEKMGVLFQIKDDELGLWADEKELGKPVGSDIAENKKTLHREILFARADEKTREKLAAIFGKDPVTREDAGFVRDRMDELGVRAEAARTAQKLYLEAAALIDSLPPRRPWTDRLRQLLDYNMSRSK